MAGFRVILKVADPQGVDVDRLFPGVTAPDLAGSTRGSTQADFSYNDPDLPGAVRAISFVGSRFEGNVEDPVDFSGVFKTATFDELFFENNVQVDAVRLATITVDLGGAGLPFGSARGMTIDDLMQSASILADANDETLTFVCKGGRGNDLIQGSSFNDNLTGGRGADTLSGGLGNDTYVLNDIFDQVVEMGGEAGGIDEVFSTKSFFLAEGCERGFLTGKAKANIVGNDADNVLAGNAGSNFISGGGGDDIFRFASRLSPKNIDRITDFSDGDSFELEFRFFSALSSGPLLRRSFKDLATGEADRNDRILYDSQNGDLFYDPDGSGRQAATRFAIISEDPDNLSNNPILSHRDFFVSFEPD